MSAKSMFNIHDFGAAADGITLDTAAIQAALDQAGENGGGIVLVPPGQYVAGNLFLRDNVTFQISTGATLIASTDLSNFTEMTKPDGKQKSYHFIIAEGVKNATICGGGIIEGRGEAFWYPAASPRAYIKTREKRLSPLVECIGCEDLRVYDITIRNSPGWTLHVHDCDRVLIRGIRIDNHLYGPNTDGIDVNGSRDVFISDCHVSCCDDAICLKSSSRSCERVVVTNCIIRTNCAALKLGAYGCPHDMRQITFSNCVVYQSMRAIGLYCIDGETYEDITFNNIVCDSDNGLPLARPIHLDLRGKMDGAPVGKVRNVKISNFIAKSSGRILMTCEKGGVMENISLQDIHLTYPEIEDSAVTAPQATSVQFSNRSPEARAARAAVVAENILRLSVRDLTITWPARYDGPDFGILWGRGLKEGFFDCPQLKYYNTEGQPYNVEDCEIVFR